MSKVLVVIDLQNDYFAGGKFPLWNAEPTLDRVVTAVQQAAARGVPVVLVQHVAEPDSAPFFVRGTSGAELHPRLVAAAPDAPVVVKAFADSFVQTTLADTLTALGATELLVCGMMTQNCVTHTAISRAAEPYDVTILADASTSVTEMIHKLALHAVSTRAKLAVSSDAI